MRLCFVDLLPWEYDVTTPGRRPFGGMQSAACYLAMALAGLGHEVSLLTHTRQPGRRSGVECLSLTDAATLSRLPHARFDAVISLAADPWPVAELFGPKPPLFLWTGHADDQPDISFLSDAASQSRWNAVILVSEWQRGRFVERFGLDPARTAVLRNAIAPAFENLFADARDLATAKHRSPPELAYTSTPFRGLQLLMTLFPLLTRPARLRVFSGMATYHGGNADEPFRDLYDLCRATPGVDYVGAVPQPRLAEALRSVNILAYPNVFPETSCIAVMEAMAAGCAVVTSDLGALAETTEGYASLIQTGDDWYAYGRRYLSTLDLAISFATSEAGLAHLWRQVQHVNRTCTWAVRAAQWTDWLETVC